VASQHLLKLTHALPLRATAAAVGQHVVVKRECAGMFGPCPIPLIEERAEFVPRRVQISIVRVNLSREDKFCHVIKIIANSSNH
jgi:hypothetical protein